MNNILDIVNPDWEANKYKLAREMVDLGMSIYRGMNERNQEIADLYRTYHGKYTVAELKKMTTVHGKISGTELKPYRLSKVKVDQLLGECLEVGFSMEVDTISPVEKQKKIEKQMKDKGRSYVKPIIQQMQKQGFHIYEGMNIPDYSTDMKFEGDEYRTMNEMISQRIANEKVKDALMRNVYYYAFASNTFTSEIFTRSTPDRNGNMSIEVIAPERMIYPRTVFDQFNDASPIIGHWTPMTFADIIREFNILKDSEKYKEIAQLFNGSITGSSGVTVPLNIDGSFNFSNIASTGTSQLTATVFYFQWRYYVDKGINKKLDGSIEYIDLTDEEKIKSMKENGESIESLRFEKIYQGAMINGQVYLGFKELENYAITRDADGRVRALYDYTCSLVKSFGGVRTSFAKVMVELSKQYDTARWMLFRELKKSRGSSIYVNKAFMADKNTDSILYDLEDKGVLNIDSKDKFDEAAEGITNGSQVVGSVSSGQGSNLIRDLISICLDLERVQDSITGMNDSRKGTEQATTTATTAQNNLQASRSVTYDLFYFTENHMERAFTHLIQKVKSATYGGSKEIYGYLPAEDIEYLENSPEYFRDNFRARMVGGRRSQQIFAELSDVVKSEVAGGKRSAADFVAIKQSESLLEAELLLKASDVRLQVIAQQSADAANQTKLQMNQNQVQASIANREDEQKFKQDLQDSVNATNIQVAGMKAQVDLITKQQVPPSPVGPKTKKS